MGDILYVVGSIEGGFISSPNAFKQTLGLFCRNNSFINPSRDVLRLGVFGVYLIWSMFVDKGGQGGVILCVESIRFFGRIINQFRSKEICFNFLVVNFMVFTKGDSNIIMRSWG